MMTFEDWWKQNHESLIQDTDPRRHAEAAWKASRADAVSAPVEPVGVVVSFDNPHVSGMTGCTFAESAVPVGTKLYAAPVGVSPVGVSEGQKQSFYFRRFVAGAAMAENIQIDQATSLEDAIKTAVRLCPDRYMTVLVHSPQPVAAQPTAPITVSARNAVIDECISALNRAPLNNSMQTDFKIGARLEIERLKAVALVAAVTDAEILEMASVQFGILDEDGEVIGFARAILTKTGAA